MINEGIIAIDGNFTGELTKDKLFAERMREIMIFISLTHDSPNMMLRLDVYVKLLRQAGGEQEKEVDIDEYGTAAVPFKQLIVWIWKNRVGGAYRFMHADGVHAKMAIRTPTSNFFTFPEFVENHGKELSSGA